MGSFLRGDYNADNLGFVQGAARILVAPMSEPYPDDIGDIVILASGATQYDPKGTWVDAGFTRTGINIVRNNAEEEYEVDQIYGSIDSRPTNWELNVGTQLAEATLESYELAWETGAISTVVLSGQPDERHMGLGLPESYTQRRVAVLYKYPNNMIRAFVFRKAQRMPQESGFTYQKTGEQVSIPVRWRALADDTVTDVKARFGDVYEQIVNTSS